MKQTTKDIVLKLLKNIDISKAAGVDNLPGRFLKDGAVILAKPVTKICYLSIKSKLFFDPCKLAKLKPISKKGSRMDASNYRPISLLSFIWKIFEKTVDDQMIDYLAQYNILYNTNPVLEQNIWWICVFHTWMTKFWRVLIMVSLLVWY